MSTGILGPYSLENQDLDEKSFDKTLLGKALRSISKA